MTTYHGWAYGVLDVGVRLGIIIAPPLRQRSEWLDRIEDAGLRRPDLTRTFPTNDRAAAARAHEALAREAVRVDLQQRLDLCR